MPQTRFAHSIKYNAREHEEGANNCKEESNIRVVSGKTYFC
jgi:hypothetical protein